jgi:hypothetical protein
MPRTLWSRNHGLRAHDDRPSTVVRVFERADSPGRIYMERAWIRGPGRVRALAHGTTRQAAENLAHQTSLARQELVLRGRDAYGERQEVTLFGLLQKYHASPKAHKWVERHRLEQERCRDFWKHELGDRAVTPAEMTPALIEEIAQNASSARGWTTRTEEKYLKYIAAVTRWGRRKARLYPTDPLEGIDLPEVRYDTRKRVYTPEEVRKLATPHPDVDWRVTLAFALATVHGRRISAILSLWVGPEEPDPDQDQDSDVAVLMISMRLPGGAEAEIERMCMHYRSEFDKEGRDDWLPVPEWLRPQIEEAMRQPEVLESGWLFPEGRLDAQDARDKPWRADSAIEALHRAERTLKVKSVAGRAYHGAKRLHVTAGFDVAGGDAVRVGDITGNVSRHVLETIYRQKDLGRMALHVDALTAMVMGLQPGGGSLNADTKTDRGKEP